MTEYHGESAKNYQQTGGKLHLLIPAIKRAIPKATSPESKLLDVACGNGDLFNLSSENGYEYFGLDLSEEMITRAKQEYPNGNYLQASATDFAGHYNHKFDIVLCIMLMNHFNTRDNIKKTLEQCKMVLKNEGVILVGVAHPCFDGYMQYGVLSRKEDIETQFKGYFNSGEKYLVHNVLDGKALTFEDHHFTFEDFFNTISEVGLRLDKIDECHPSNSTGASEEYISKKSNFPTYLLFSCRR